jgi:hypothetical protein
MPFKGKKDGTWSDASVVYGKSGGVWLYGKYAVAKKDGVWSRAWTDCRKFDVAGGRDWSAPTTVVTYSGSCSTRTQTTTVTRTKTGCPNDVRATTVAAPDCTGCTGTPYVSNSCSGCGSITTTPGTGGCPDTTSGSCGTWNAHTSGANSVVIDGQTWTRLFSDQFDLNGSEGCDPGCTGGTCFSVVSGFIQKCSLSDTYRVASSFCGCTC